jgi:hypothetical protein
MKSLATFLLAGTMLCVTTAVVGIRAKVDF